MSKVHLIAQNKQICYNLNNLRKDIVRLKCWSKVLVQNHAEGVLIRVLTIKIMRRLDRKTFDRRINAGVYWYKVKNPLRIIANGLILSFAKYFPSLPVKRGLLRLTGVRVGKNVSVAPSTIDPIFPELIDIGDNVMIGWDTMILTHEIIGSEFRKGRVKIGENTTIGARSLILAGVKIGKNAIIEADSLVNKDVKDNCIVGDVPIKQIKLK